MAGGLAGGDIVVHVGVLWVHPPLNVRRSRASTLFKAQALAHAVHAVRFLLGHLRDAVETLSAERLLLHHLSLEVPAVSLLG